MKVQTVKVNPELAKQWLAKNNKNRRISESHIKKLTKAMLNNEWVFNGESICFDSELNLLDGQHRLAAVVRSGMSFNFVVVTGVEDDRAFQTYDTIQKKRSADQIAEMMGGERNLTRLSAAARIIMYWERSRTMDEFARLIRTGFPVNWQPSPAEIAEKSIEIEHEFNYYWDYLGAKFRKIAKPTAQFYAIMIILGRIDPVETSMFCDKLNGFSFDGDRDPCLQFREKLIAKSPMLSKSVKATPREVTLAYAALHIKAWNMHKKGENDKLLRYYGDGENFPRPIGSDKK